MSGIYLFETKTKSRIDEVQIRRQLTFDLQTMIYLVALSEASQSELAQKGWTNQTYKKGVHNLSISNTPIRGVRYNVIRRTEHRVTQKDGGTEGFCERLKGIIEEAPQDWFMRWQVEIGPHDIARFRKECLDPVLEQLCDWWYMIKPGFEFGGTHNNIHFRFPYGVWNPLLEGTPSDLDGYLESGSEVGLRRVSNLFEELG